jgi:hypothetical protein
MADVSIYVALISATAGVAGGTVPSAIAAIRDGHRAERDRQEQLAEARRQACVELLRTVLELRVHIANKHDYHGGEMAAQVGAIRELAAAAEVAAVSIALMVPPGLAKAAERLAEVAGRVAAVASDPASLQLGASPQEPPDFSELDECVVAFKAQAVTDGRG